MDITYIEKVAIRTVMAIRGMAMAAAAKNRYRNAPVGSAPRSGNWPWTNQRRVMLNSQEIINDRSIP